jgi:hypothetical protein
MMIARIILSFAAPLRMELNWQHVAFGLFDNVVI